MSAAIEIRNAGRLLWLDNATDEWVLEQDGQVLRSTDKTEIEECLDRLDAEPNTRRDG